MKILNLKSSIILASLAIIFFSSLYLTKEGSKDTQDNLKINRSAVPIKKTNFKLVKKGQLKNEVKKSLIKKIGKLGKLILT
jgi:hypothetical protein